MNKGLIFNIQKFCINDGPGIRTTVFFKGCPLNCKWCHNPESNLCKPQIMYNSEKCVRCGLCDVICPQGAHNFEDVHRIDRKKCISCGKCAEKCPHGAVELVGKEYSVQEVLEEVLKDKVFYDTSGGGLTLSGGEPLMQFDFAYQLLRKAKECGIHTCIETCGFVKTEDILKIAEVTDIFLFDWKLSNDNQHMKYTGKSNVIILENLKAIDLAGSKIILRCPIIPGVNNTTDHFEGIANIANSLKNVVVIEIEPYHSLGNNKRKKLGQEEYCGFSNPAQQEIDEWITQIRNITKITVRKA